MPIDYRPAIKIARSWRRHYHGNCISSLFLRLADLVANEKHGEERFYLRTVEEAQERLRTLLLNAITMAAEFLHIHDGAVAPFVEFSLYDDMLIDHIILRMPRVPERRAYRIAHELLLDLATQLQKGEFRYRCSTIRLGADARSFRVVFPGIAVASFD